MVHIAAADHAAPPELDIHLNQNPNAFFFPASTISGHVTYKNHYGSADYDLRLIFRGSNKVALRNSARPVADIATLFEYTFNLHTARKGQNHRLANSQVDTAPMSYAFKHRFPSATDNRSFRLAGTSAADAPFNNHPHDLPPSFGSQCHEFGCSVEYCLRAELYSDNCLLTDCTLPVMFLPYMRPMHGTRHNLSMLSTTSTSAAKELSKARKDSLVNLQSTTVPSIGVELPAEITIGQPFAFEVQLQCLSAPEYDDELPRVSVPSLRVVSSAHCRSTCSLAAGLRHQGRTQKDQKYHQNARHILLRPSRSASPPALDPATANLCYSFQATLSSYHSPTFRSFLVSNSFRFDGPLAVTIDNHKLEVSLGKAEVVVLSPVAQQTTLRRVSTMTAGILAETLP